MIDPYAVLAVISDLRSEVESWKRRAIEAETENARLRGQSGEPEAGDGSGLQTAPPSG